MYFALIFFIFIEIIKRDVVVWKIPAIQKRKSGMELEVKDGALLWQSIEIDESKKSV